MSKDKKEKKPANPTVKSAVISCISALLCVAILIYGSTSIADSISNNKKEVAEIIHGTGEQSDYIEDVFDDTGDDNNDTPADDNGGISGDDTQKDDVGTDDPDPADNGSSSEVTPDDNNPTEPATTPADNGGSSSNSKTPANKAKTTAEIISIYNAATKKAVDKKVPFTKTRTTTEKRFDAGAVLKGMKDIVYKFMGVGDSNKFSKTVTKEDSDSYFKYLQASRLTAADVSSASIKESNGTSTITLVLKNGSSKVENGKLVSAVNNTALDKCGVSQGQDDKDYWDHKNAQNVFAAIDEVPGCKSANISESYSNAAVTMVIDSNGNIKNFVVKFNFKAELSKVMGSSGTAEASSLVTMSNFKW